MQTYIGTKIIKARPMNRGDYNLFQGWNIPENENPEDPGQLVGYPDAHSNFDGGLEGGCHYISWSPADVFDASYKPITGMSFGLAIEAMKAGYKVARSGWNGKGMFIYIVSGTEIPIDNLKNECRNHVFPLHSEFSDCETTQKICSHIDMKAVDGSIVVGWLASQTDVLANDWVVV